MHDRTAATAPLCGRCEGRSWIPIVYGYPHSSAVNASEAGRVALGGCIIEPSAPVKQCQLCGHRDGTPLDWTAREGPRTGEFGDHAVSLDDAAAPCDGGGEICLADFALGFDAYEAMGASTVRAVGSRARRQFERSGSLRDNLLMLRACLFFEQRAARHTDSTLDTPYVRALVAAIAGRINKENDGP